MTLTVNAAAGGTGRMTGGGTIDNGQKGKDKGPSHGFTLHCDVNELPNNLEVNWDGGNKFHLELLTSAECSDDPSIQPKPPTAGFDTFVGAGTGRFNGEDGATIEFLFTDAGEPGKNDFASITIRDVHGNVVLNVSGYLKNGNQQAHDD